jgi:hypothetical protein
MRPYYEAKADADQFVADGGLDYTIVRPGCSRTARTGKVEVAENLDRSGSVSATTSRWSWPRS